MKEIKVLEGKVVAPEGMKVGIVASRFNEIIVNKLLGGAVDGLVRHGVEEENITAAWVPGAFEIPVAASAMAKSGKYDAIICVGAVIKTAFMKSGWAFLRPILPALLFINLWALLSGNRKCSCFYERDRYAGLL